MYLPLLLAAQAVVPAEPGDPLASFDLRRIKRSSECGSGESGEIVVCGRLPRDSQRLEALPEGFEDRPLRAELALGGGATASATVSQVDMPAGVSSKRLMLNFKMPF